MAERAILFAIMLVILVVFLVVLVEHFEPLSAKADMNAYCRNAMIKMEIEGGLKNNICSELEAALAARGFTNIVINAPVSVPYGERMTLSVQASYTYSKLTGVFTRENVTQEMSYVKTTTSRKVIN